MTGSMRQIWSLGHRNVLGLAIDLEGQLWDIEMGPSDGDELNLIKRAANYGYPIVSAGDLLRTGVRYRTTTRIRNSRNRSDFVEPRHFAG